jgi:uncharacterized C2H2 Zn-finger protein
MQANIKRVSTSKNNNIFDCFFCDYVCRYESDYLRHVGTAKHIRLTNANKKNEKNEQLIQHECSCGKIYQHMSSLCKHKRKCVYIIKNPIIEEEDEKTDIFSPNMLMDMMKQNNELTKQIIELSSKPTTTNNTTNNSFNLNFFLNETCKDALNITDFINQLQVGTKDLEETGRLGYAEGISKIFINGLKKLNVNQRPVHCSDAKRETIYIKDGDQWEKDNDEKIKLTNAIRDVAHKNIEQIQVWTELHPEYTDLKSKYNDRYMKLIGEAMSGSTNEETYRNYKKIARNIMRETIIVK